MADDGERLARSLDLKTDVAHSARLHDYMLGGKDNFAADRDAAEKVMKVAPYMRTSMRASRRFMVRLVRYLAAERGIRQFPKARAVDDSMVSVYGGVARKG